MRYIGQKNICIYINTLYPFGAALGAKLTGKKIIYHIHENPVIKSILQRFAIRRFEKLADRAIFVSDYLYNSYRMPELRKSLIYNSLLPEYIETAGKHYPSLSNPESILMACSLKIYKGVNLFIDLAERLPQYSFFLLLNAGKDETNRFFIKKIIPSNLSIISGLNDLDPFYRKVHLVLNLSIPDLWIESFGLTILEAMAYGIPAIVPPAGGIAELIEDNFNGFKIDPYDLHGLVEKITFIFSDRDNYQRLSANARSKALDFSFKKMIDDIEVTIAECFV